MEQGNRDQFEKTETADPKAEQLKEQNKLLTDLWKLKQPGDKLSAVRLTTKTGKKLYVETGQMKNRGANTVGERLKPTTYTDNTWFIKVEGAGQSFVLTFQKGSKVILTNGAYSEERTLSDDEANKMVDDLQKNVNLLEAKKTQEKKKEFKAVIDTLARQDSESADDILQMLT